MITTMSPSAVMETILRCTFAAIGKGSGNRGLQEARQRIRSVGRVGIVLNEIGRKVFGDQLGVVGFQNLAEKIQNEPLVRFELFVGAFDQSLRIGHTRDRRLRKERRAHKQQKKFHA
jgi:hypothetical protein